MKSHLTNHFTDHLISDLNKEKNQRQVVESMFSWVTPVKPSHPKLIHVSREVQQELGFSQEEVTSTKFLDFVTGNGVLKTSKPYAMCYGGHQFGHWAGQLGDGRAINLGEINGKTIQLKGAGPTPYSRNADGFAVLRSSIREYLCSEAMHHLGIPTTRVLSLSLTGDLVMRDMMYDGNPAYEKGAITSRVARSFLRFGNYEIFAARNDIKNLRRLVHYTINTYFPALGKPSKEVYVCFFQAVTNSTLEMIIHWQRVGFVHGVMNTDNMSVLGLTIDYGPYGWLEGFDLDWTPNTTDRQHKRYRYGNQPNIGLWNLHQMANALYPLVEEAAPFEAILEDYKTRFETKSQDMMRSKLGLRCSKKTDQDLIAQLEDNLRASETDMTLFFRQLSLFKADAPVQGIQFVSEAFYRPEEIQGMLKEQWDLWFTRYASRLKDENINYQQRRKRMNLVNPKYILRNYMAQLAIDKAENGDYSLIEEFYELLKKPYDEQPHSEQWFAKRPEWARHKVGCSMLSCSS